MNQRRVLKAFALVLGLLVLAASAFAAPWKFGVIADTQWTRADDGRNPNTCAADIIRQVDRRFIAAGVKLVIHVGDMVDKGSRKNDYTRALYAQDLYNAGIGFYPLRGNHEAAHGSYLDSGRDYRHAYPQIVPGPGAGLNNNTPADIDIITTAIPPFDLENNPPAAKTRPDIFAVGRNFSAPEAVNAATGGVSYAFDYQNATFLLLDQFKSPDDDASYIPAQQQWIDRTLSGRPAGTHAFVFAHKNILGGRHKDNIFGGQVTQADPGDGYGAEVKTPAELDALAAKQNAENAFLASMQANGVRYVISGHDHHHYHSVITSPDGRSRVHQLIGQSASSKFYTPGPPVSALDLPIEQDLDRIGYYIFTVNGPRVTIDYYAGGYIDWTAHDFVTAAAFDFRKRSSTGYSLNGKEKLVAQGASYAMTDDTRAAAAMAPGIIGTQMAILAGRNAGTTRTNYGKPSVRAVNTGWAPAEAGLAGDILSLWGLTAPGSEETDTYVLSMRCGQKTVLPAREAFVIAARDENGGWVDAADRNFGGQKTFVNGPWKPGCALGAYGFDPASQTAWAVINHSGDFALVRSGIPASPNR